MVERSDCCADRTRDINVRVGMNSPPAEGTGGDAAITVNELCGIFLGPGQTGSTSILTCDGEYLWQRRYYLQVDIYFCFRTKIWPLCNFAASELS